MQHVSLLFRWSHRYANYTRQRAKWNTVISSGSLADTHRNARIVLGRLAGVHHRSQSIDIVHQKTAISSSDIPELDGVHRRLSHVVFIAPVSSRSWTLLSGKRSTDPYATVWQPSTKRVYPCKHPSIMSVILTFRDFAALWSSRWLHNGYPETKGILWISGSSAWRATDI